MYRLVSCSRYVSNHTIDQTSPWLLCFALLILIAAFPDSSVNCETAISTAQCNICEENAYLWRPTSKRVSWCPTRSWSIAFHHQDLIHHGCSLYPDISALFRSQDEMCPLQRLLNLTRTPAKVKRCTIFCHTSGNSSIIRRCIRNLLTQLLRRTFPLTLNLSTYRLGIRWKHAPGALVICSSIRLISSLSKLASV